jgi:hypothetical protein
VGPSEIRHALPLLAEFQSEDPTRKNTNSSFLIGYLKE